MKEQFCTYEIAKQLKEFGFNERCFGCWENNTEYGIPFIVRYDLATPEYYNLKKDCIAAPLWQQVIDWLLETHNIFITFEDHTFVDMINDGSGYKYYIDVYGCCEVGIRKCPFFDTYKLAREHAILKSIKLIKEQNEKY